MNLIVSIRVDAPSRYHRSGLRRGGDPGSDRTGKGGELLAAAGRPQRNDEPLDAAEEQKDMGLGLDHVLDRRPLDRRFEAREGYADAIVAEMQRHVLVGNREASIHTTKPRTLGHGVDEQ